jgi:hypothetical protein
MSASDTTSSAGGVSVKILLLGFVAGFLAVPLGHQIMSLILFYLIPGRNFPWNMAANKAAFNLPAIVNLSFWGGVWGILWALIEPYVPKGAMYWIIAILFGGICATAIGAYVVTALKGLPMGSITWIGFALNGMWGLATAFFFDQLRSRI